MSVFKEDYSWKGNVWIKFHGTVPMQCFAARWPPLLCLVGDFLAGLLFVTLFRLIPGWTLSFSDSDLIILIFLFLHFFLSFSGHACKDVGRSIRNSCGCLSFHSIDKCSYTLSVRIYAFYHKENIAFQSLLPFLSKKAGQTMHMPSLFFLACEDCLPLQ